MSLIRPLRSLTALAVLLSTALPLAADSSAGSYLAARQADYASDYRAVVEYGTRTLAQDPENVDIMEGLLIAYLGLGDFDTALPVARRMVQLMPDSQVAGLVLLADAVKREDWARVQELQAGGTSVGGLMDDMIAVWSQFGVGQVDKAFDAFEALGDEPGTGGMARYHQAMAYAMAGDHENAARLFSGDEGRLQMDRTGIIAYAQVLSQLERSPDAVEMLDKVAPNTTDPTLVTMRAELSAGKPQVFDALTSPREAIAQVVFKVADTLAAEADPTVVLLYARLAEFLDSDTVGATLLSARLLESMERYELAVAAYDSVPPDHSAYPQAALGQSDALRRMGRVDEAIGELRALTKAYPELAAIHVALGDALRFEDRFAEAIPAYDAAIALYEAPVASQWVVYFARAICLEREKNWPAAEADFRYALELSPDQPNVLNYLGYSFVEMQTNLDEALGMIERAVAGRPNDGYITDSLGWVYYRLGRYDEAVDQMERAVELMPVDPVVNDHLGDTYWAVGRHREAEFQWSRALSFITDDSDLDEVKPDRIRRKLEVGLDVVLDEEGAEPLHAVE
ncbi:tetratricopeptide repeat protein [Aliiroseovarius subalbicans]|uniref:tetratricopeptide repeat protein n=1 Tax=Aliiroseovarius subalbicans TaxID=2925840 RepID=UPI001F5686D3|nr:tetratricopeptide repeat protein [Aliiroseovarius subalbicans]MCI2399561.1 tetratricopeptide repeat protein [Aliiroseovarius subalbicans]